MYFSRFVLPLQQLSITPVPEKPVLRTARIFRTTGGCCVPGAPENAPRTREGGFRYRISLPYHRSPFLAPSAPENASRTTGACFAHRTHIPYHRRPSPVPNEPNATNGRGKKPLPQTEPSANSSQMPGKRSLSPDSTTGNPTNTRKKKPLPQTAPSANSPQPQSRGSREIFIQAAVLPRMDLTIF